jgi:heme A synthase
MHRHRFTTLLWTVLALCLGIILWRAWVRAGGPGALGPVTAADAAWAAARAVASFLVLAALALAAWRTATGNLRLSAGGGRLRRLAAVALAGTLAVGASGAVSALAAAAGSFKDLRILHPLIAVVVSLLLLRLASAVRQRLRQPGGETAAAARTWVNRLHALVLAQLALGTLNTVVTASVGIQLVHLLLADLVWIALVLTCAGSLWAPAPAPTPAEDTGLKTRAKKGKPPEGG